MANFVGGYSQIDCSGIDLITAEKQTIAGIYAQVKNAAKANKAVLACNMVFSQKPCTPVYVMVNADPAGTTTYVCTASTLQLWVDKDDGVTVVNMAPANRTATKSKKED